MVDSSAGHSCLRSPSSAWRPGARAASARSKAVEHEGDVAATDRLLAPEADLLAQAPHVCTTISAGNGPSPFGFQIPIASGLKKPSSFASRGKVRSGLAFASSRIADADGVACAVTDDGAATTSRRQLNIIPAIGGRMSRMFQLDRFIWDPHGYRARIDVANADPLSGRRSRPARAAC